MIAARPEAFWPFMRIRTSMEAVFGRQSRTSWLHPPPQGDREMHAHAAILAVLLMGFSPPGWCSPAEECRQKVHKEIDRLNALMRQGYTARQGIRYQALRKELGDLRARCDRQPQVWKAIPKF